MQNTKPHAALLSSPGLGHFIPVIELGKRLVTNHGFSVTVFVVTTDNSLSKSQLLKQSPCPDLLNIVLLPPVDVSSLITPATGILAQLAIMMREALPKTEYAFITSTAWFLALTLHMPTIDKKFDGILVNTWQDLEGTTLGALEDGKKLWRVAQVPPIYPVGPLVRAVKPGPKTATVFKTNHRTDDTPDFLPDGFLTRTRKIGTRRPNDIGVAIRSKSFPAKELVVREEIETMVRTIMDEGDARRARVRTLKSSAEKALSKAGSSYNSLAQVANDCESAFKYLKAKAQGA
ncbi:GLYCOSYLTRANSFERASE [Salix purpurea]|uniref:GLYCOSYLTRANSFERASE n=1 Tax=Salix purpurea TaxID=77065 RepID=A0A9Q0ZMP4_SALPP|nr:GLYCOSYLTRANSFERASE [Salix purpurea]